MKHELEFKNFEPAPEIRKRIGNGIARLERKLRGLGQDPLFLRSVVEEVSGHKRFRVIVTLVVPHKTLAAKEETHDAEAAMPHDLVDPVLTVDGRSDPSKWVL